ncbi:type VII secretion protein EssB [Bacillus ectoiniformans]|uniref:type VII secretion protein EssB n=1 Tax=Bacillus ectoiniformans TaxID=1494429 RepID=UPI00195879BE|nr:type VII secretion protein EssB [Bacillus ectoiniformans]MBM7649223.1 type VII secretion protein EssB [Bacillus ectoiniformans]
MKENHPSYLENRIEGNIRRPHTGGYDFIFQKARLKLEQALEINMIVEADPQLNKKIESNEDEIILNVQPPSYFSQFQAIHSKPDIAKWIFMDQLIKKVQRHSYHRLIPVVCPENIMFDSSFTPYFLHYGVIDSLPPYEREENDLFSEVKATLAAIIDDKHKFNDYLRFQGTIKLSAAAADLLAAENWHELTGVVSGYIQKLEEQEKSLIHIPQKKWKIQRSLFYGATVILIPVFIYTLYSMFILAPKQEAFVESGEHFLNKKYSQVIETLDEYEAESMPYIVQYELASSYLVNESLMENQKKNVLKTMTLQTDPAYFLYWIYIGRGMNQEAIDQARDLEDRELTMYGLIKLKEEIKANESLSSEEKQKEIEVIEQELNEYVKEKEEEEKMLKEQQEKEQKEKQQISEPQAEPAPPAAQPAQTPAPAQPKEKSL